MKAPVGFDAGTASTCAKLVQLAYAQHKMSGWNLGEEYAILQTFDAEQIPYGRAVFGFAASNQSGDVYIIFRGTDSISDWVANLHFKQHSYGKINLDSGFMGIFKYFIKRIKDSVKDCKGRIIASGHSLGGALATLAALELGGRVELFTFASPRVGDGEFAKVFNANQKQAAWRIVNTEDIVPTIPLPVLDLPLPFSIGDCYYTHVGTPVCFTVNTGSLTGNHAMSLYANEVS